MIPETRYAETADGLYIAYQVAGEGPVDLVWQFTFLGNVELAWEEPTNAVVFDQMAAGTRLILHDRRGTGLSSRNVSPPNLETRVADLRVVLDAVGSKRPVLAGESDGGAPNVLFAASDPERVHSIVWLYPTARMMWSPDYPWGVRPDQTEFDERALQHWGTLEGARAWAKGEAMFGHVPTEEELHWYAKLSRHTGTPDVGRELTRNWAETDLRSVLPSVKVPTLLLVQDIDARAVEEAEYIASLMPQAEFKTLPAASWTSPKFAWQRKMSFSVLSASSCRGPTWTRSLPPSCSPTSSPRPRGSPPLGDNAWKDLIQRHHTIVRDALRRWHGIEADTAGDGFYATFDGPARAIRCALDVTERIRELGIEVRAGVHTGECEVADGKCTGIAVSIGARVASTAGPSEVRVSQTVKDLVAGSGLAFKDAGVHEFKGDPDRWRLYSAASD